jgi:leucyl-tRNA synthetase
MFASPPEQTLEWSDSGVEGASRFLRRLWSFAYQQHRSVRSAPDDVDAAALSRAVRDLRFEIHTILRRASYDYERKQYNTVVSAAMKMLNALEAGGLQPEMADAAGLRECLSILVRCLYPVVPHITHALWQALDLGRGRLDLIDAPWPVVDEQALVRDTVTMVLQINGKTRGSLDVPAGADKEVIERLAAKAPEVARQSEGRPPRRIVVVPGRLVNVVV